MSRSVSNSDRATQRRAKRGLWLRRGFVGVFALSGAGLLWVIQGPRFSGEPRSRLSPASLGIALYQSDSPPNGAADLGASDGKAVGDSTAPSDMMLIAGGQFWMGSSLGAVDEQPRHETRLERFWIDIHEVTKGQYAKFIQATGYVTTAERVGYSWIFDRQGKHWRPEPAASWRMPDGHDVAAADMPVTQVSWSDVDAYARWAGKRLPTEAEWEYAAAGGLIDADYPWGRDLRTQGRYEANYWQGWFPDQDLGSDGFVGTAPVRSYRANRYGLYDMAGNVWEWCGDWHAADYYQYTPTSSPRGPATGEARVLRGGSWLSAENSSRGLKVYAREHLAPSLAREDIGFRCARDAAP
jgi:formylglycine-generating enzyme